MKTADESSLWIVAWAAEVMQFQSL